MYSTPKVEWVTKKALIHQHLVLGKAKNITIQIIQGTRTHLR